MKYFTPKVNNKIVSVDSKESSLISGRKPKTSSDITHAQRKISQAELTNITKSGYAEAPKTGSRYTKGGLDKWWSPADKSGSFGRNWEKGSLTIRAKVEDVPKNRAVSAKKLEIKVGDSWEKVPVSKYAAQKTVAKIVTKVGAKALGVAGMAYSLYEDAKALEKAPKIQYNKNKKSPKRK